VSHTIAEVLTLGKNVALETDAMFRLDRFTEVPEFTYLGKHFPCVNAN